MAQIVPAVVASKPRALHAWSEPGIVGIDSYMARIRGAMAVPALNVVGFWLSGQLVSAMLYITIQSAGDLTLLAAVVAIASVVYLMS